MKTWNTKRVVFISHESKKQEWATFIQRIFDS